MIKKIFEEFKKSHLDDVAGVIVHNSGKPGPVLGITVCTHGNELSGLEAAHRISRWFEGGSKLKHGSVMLVLNNIKAAEKALRSKNPHNCLSARYIDVNMNRLPRNLCDLNFDSRYEVVRARELLPIWKKFDVALDIHSMTHQSPPILIAPSRLNERTIAGFPMKTIIRSIDKVQVGKPAFAFYGNRPIEAVVIEAGQHAQKISVKRAEKSIRALLHNLGMVKNIGRKAKLETRNEYVITSSVIAEPGMIMSKQFRNFERIKKGQILAVVGPREVLSPFDGHIVMVPKGRKVISRGEEAFFLSKPVKRQ